MARQGIQDPKWYPTPSTPRGDVDRIIFDNLYRLEDAAKTNGKSATPTSGMTVTARFAGGFQVGGKTFYNMTFQDGRLVGVS